MSFEEGAAVPIAYSTAWEALIRAANLQRGERVLIQAAAGGVGIAATQIAKRAGAEVWGTASPGKHEAIRGFGVDHPIDYTRAGWERGVPKLDVVMDAIGGASFRRSYKLLRAGGRLVCFGASGMVSGENRNDRRRRTDRAQHAVVQPDQADGGLEVRDRTEHADGVGRVSVRRPVA